MGDKRPIGTYSTRELRAICQGTAPNPARESLPGLFCRLFSIYFTRFFLYTDIHPNAITAISVSIFFLGIANFFSESLTAHVIGSFLVFLSVVIDGCDGEVARFRKQTGPVGGNYVEPVSHDIQYGVSFFLLGFAVSLQTGWLLPFALGSIAAITKLEYRLLEIRYWFLAYKDAGTEKIADIKASYDTMPFYKKVIYWINKNVFSSSDFWLVLLIFSLAERLDLMLWLFAIGYALLWLALSAKQYWTIYRNYGKY
ncbi:CDP-alcohol phosphatidyltransferase family protein [bacterium]|nr:CDP-alcohol phosphatidyltransferase family protein [bacterium]